MKSKSFSRLCVVWRLKDFAQVGMRCRYILTTNGYSTEGGRRTNEGGCMTQLELLLAKLANARNMPVPEPAAPMSLGPLRDDTALAIAALNPEPVPPRFVQPSPV